MLCEIGNVFKLGVCEALGGRTNAGTEVPPVCTGAGPLQSFPVGWGADGVLSMGSGCWRVALTVSCQFHVAPSGCGALHADGAFPVSDEHVKLLIAK